MEHVHWMFLDGCWTSSDSYLAPELKRVRPQVFAGGHGASIPGYVETGGPSLNL